MKIFTVLCLCLVLCSVGSEGFRILKKLKEFFHGKPTTPSYNSANELTTEIPHVNHPETPHHIPGQTHLPQTPKFPELATEKEIPYEPEVPLPEIPKLPEITTLKEVPSISEEPLPEIPVLPEVTTLKQTPYSPEEPLPEIPEFPEITPEISPEEPLPKIPDLPESTTLVPPGPYNTEKPLPEIPEQPEPTPSGNIPEIVFPDSPLLSTTAPGSSRVAVPLDSGRNFIAAPSRQCASGTRWDGRSKCRAIVRK